MVEQNRSGTYREIAYAPTGDKLALMSGQSLQEAFVPLPGGATAVYNSSGLAYYRHADWLGSSRLASTPSRGIYFDTAYGPFGEPYAQSGTTDLSFTGQNQDTVSALYDFPFREYGIQGRWPSPDPAGLAAVNPGDPQSWNRYAYVRNSPLTLVDPLGLQNNCRQTDDCERRHQFTDAVTPWNCDLWGICDSSNTCYVNGFLASCGFAFGLLQQGLAGICPNNDCSASAIQTGPDGQWQIFVQGDPGSNCGKTTDPATGEEVGTICASFGQWVDVQISYPGADAGGSSGPNAAPTFCNPATGICVPRSMIPPPGPSTVQRLGKWAKAYLCGNSPGDAIKEWFVFGAIKGAAVGAITGGVTGTVLGVGVGSAAGVPMGAFTGFTLGATNGLTGGLVAAAVCSAAGVYH